MLDKSMFVLNMLSSENNDFITIIIITVHHLESSLQSFNSS